MIPWTTQNASGASNARIVNRLTVVCRLNIVCSSLMAIYRCFKRQKSESTCHNNIVRWACLVWWIQINIKNSPVNLNAYLVLRPTTTRNDGVVLLACT